MGYEWIAAAASAAASGIGAVAGQHPSKSRRYAKELAVFNNNLARENWQMQNAYDTPAAQMQRYQDAGLNPNLIYGQQNTGGTIQSGSATYDADSMVPNEGKALRGIGDAIANYQQIRSMQIQNSNANLVGRLTSEQIREKEISNDVQASLAPYRIESQALAVQDMTFKVLFKNQADYKKTLAQINSEIARKQEILENTKLKGAQYDKVREEITNLQKSRDLMDARIDLIDQQITDLEELRPFKKGAYQASAASGFASANYTNTKEGYVGPEFERALINDTNQADGLLGFGKMIQSYMRSKDHAALRKAKKSLREWAKQLKNQAKKGRK